jgi:kumamolisin
MRKIIAGIVALSVVLGTIAAVSLSPTSARQASEDRKVFTNSVVPLPAEPGLTKSGLMVKAAAPEHKSDKMEILFSLAMPKEAREKLAAKVAKGEVVSPEELERDYSPKAADVDKLTAWLKDQGFTVTHTTANRTSVYAEGTVGQIEKSLQVKMVRVTKDALTYNAAQNAPSMPADVAAGVQAIIGLQPFRQAHKHARKRPTPSPRPAIGNAPPYLVAEVLKAYGADNLGVTGDGQVIAILIDTVPADTDVKAFWNHNHVAGPLTRVEKVNVKGGHLPAPDGEETLDVEWASGVAPGAKVRVYASGSLSFVDLDRALDRIIADMRTEPAPRQLSISLGLGEQFMPSGEAQIESDKFLALAAVGVNVFVSSGDAGSNPDETGHSATGPQQAECSSSDPSVVGVGGTSLFLNPGGEIDRELGWDSSGGGPSVIFDRPGWQTGDGVPAGTKRLVPDVSLAADPERGAFVFLHGHQQQIGGTSWSAPTWGGLCALMNEARGKAGKPPLPFLNPMIYPLIGTPCFRDITVGSNGGFNAGKGYDMVTGIGVPNVRELIQALTK